MTTEEKEKFLIEKFVRLVFYGVKIKDIQPRLDRFGLGIIDGYEIYFSIPENFSLQIDEENEEYNKKLNTKNGLIQIAEELIIDILMNLYDDNFITDEDINDIKSGKTNFINFHIVERKNEIWNEEKTLQNCDILTNEIEKFINNKSNYKGENNK